ncbi:MAG: iron ABC transporter permease [Deinococcus sp.]|nr:iron ABC transporter permease [Deinococcus sp.]
MALNRRRGWAALLWALLALAAFLALPWIRAGENFLRFLGAEAFALSALSLARRVTPELWGVGALLLIGLILWLWPGSRRWRGQALVLVSTAGLLLGLWLLAGAAPQLVLQTSEGCQLAGEVGQRITCVITVLNHGQAPAERIDLRQELPRGRLENIAVLEGESVGGRLNPQPAALRFRIALLHPLAAAQVVYAADLRQAAVPQPVAVELNAIGRNGFGLGALVVFLTFLVLLGAGLSAAGYLRTDSFVATGVVLCSAFVTLFILYPVFTILRKSLWGASGFSLEPLEQALSSAAFFQVQSSDWRAVGLVMGLAGGGSVLALVLQLWRKRSGGDPLPLGWSALAVGVAVYVLSFALPEQILSPLGYSPRQRATAGAIFLSRLSWPLLPAGFAWALAALALGWGTAVAERWAERCGGWNSWRKVLLPVLAVTGLAGSLALLWLSFGALRNSLLLAILVGLSSTLCGLAFALLAARSRSPLRFLLAPFSVLPIITPPFVLGLATILLLGQNGLITRRWLGLSTSVFFGPLGVGLAQTLAYTPIAYLVLVGVVQSLDKSLEEAGSILGAGRWTVFRTIVWPLLRPGLANACLLGMIESLADFGNPLVLGGGAQFLATEIFFALDRASGQERAAALGLVLLAISLAAFLAQRYWVGRRSYVTVTGKPSGAGFMPLPALLEKLLLGFAVLWAAFNVLLYGSVFLGGVVVSWGRDHTLTWRHAAAFFTDADTALQTSLKLAAASALPAALLGFLIAYLVVRQRFAGRSLLEFSAMLSFAIPGTVMGIGYILAFHLGLFQLTQTGAIIVLAFIFRNMPVGIRGGVAALTQIDRSLEEASTTLRAGAAYTLARVLLPLVRPALIAGLVFAFVRAMTAISQVIFLVTPRYRLITEVMLRRIEQGNLGLGAFMSAVMILALGLAIWLMYLLLAALASSRRVLLAVIGGGLACFASLMPYTAHPFARLVTGAGPDAIGRMGLSVLDGLIALGIGLSALGLARWALRWRRGAHPLYLPLGLGLVALSAWDLWGFTALGQELGPALALLGGLSLTAAPLVGEPAVVAVGPREAPAEVAVVS